MAEATEKELAMLSNYMYMDTATEKVCIGELLASMQDAEGNIDTKLLPKASGGLSKKDVTFLFREMNKASEEFKSMTVTEVLSEEGIRGACFENASGEATVVFRGTGGEYEGWIDNLINGYHDHTIIQNQAVDFVKNQCGRYSNVTIAGHSKGGYVSQRTTVLCGDQVDRCISFDGQGHSVDFLKSHLTEVKAAQGKIKSISAYNDFVNILLTSIAGRRIFVQNKGVGIEGHKSIRLLTDNEFDPETGAFISIRKQDPDMMVLQLLLTNGVIHLDELPIGVSKGVYNTLASILAGVLSSDKSLKYKIFRTTYAVTQYQQSVIMPASEGFGIDLKMLSSAQEELEIGQKALIEVWEVIDGLSGVLAQKLAIRMKIECQMIKVLSEMTENVIQQYYNGEQVIQSFLTE